MYYVNKGKNKNMKEEKDVIAAIATPRGKGAISCVRLSGKGSAEIVKKLTEGYGEIKHAVMKSCKFSGRIKDRIMAVIYTDGNSYTGEESAELYFHGGRLLTEQALLSVIDAGARLAEAGEFTRRAFLNGKIDLTQAEGIGDLIDGESISALKGAYDQSEGKIKKAIDGIYSLLTSVAAAAEVGIDYPEEDIEEQTGAQVLAGIEEIRKKIKKETDGYNGGRIRREGARIVITGKTNAGKSTLFNSLLGEDRAIVSDEEGTTRDTIEEKMSYKGEAFVLVDTAGIRETESKAERMGIERSRTAVREADITVKVVKKDEIYEVKELDENEILVVNSFENTIGCVDGAIELNAKSGEGTEILKEELYKRVKKITGNGGCINNARQYSALKEADECLIRAQHAVKELTPDCVCSDLANALEALGNVTGKNASDSIINEIFSKFCVGK